jgi:23S rRNA pseudouridine1911/1915/1917 synthase
MPCHVQGTHTTVAGESGRLDRALTAACPELSRARVQALIVAGCARVNGAAVTSASHKVQAGDTLGLDIPPPEPSALTPEDMALDVVYEDAALIVLNKPPGLVVHPGAGRAGGTLVNALLHHCAGGLSGIGGVERPGIVHRLDKDTSGLMLAAKTDAAHRALAAQLADRTMGRAYAALVMHEGLAASGVVDAPIARDPRHRLKMAVRAGGRAAVTRWRVVGRAGPLALLSCRLESGRTHQIRVHMAHVGMPVLGDPLYGPQPTRLAAAARRAGIDPAPFLAFGRQALHARAIRFTHPDTGAEMAFEASPPPDMAALIARLAPR